MTLLHIRDATQSPGKSPIFSSLKIGGGRGVNPDFGKIETKDSNYRDRASVGQLEKLRLRPKKKLFLSPVSRPTLKKGADPKNFAKKNFFFYFFSFKNRF